MRLGNLFILGDSYSTYKGYIPEGYNAYYKDEGPAYLCHVPDNKLCEDDVVSVKQTWWHQLVSETNATLVRNSSYSGTTICNTGYDGRDWRDISFNGRFDKLANEGFFTENKIDTFLIFGGTNDSWANSPVGENKYSDWNDKDLYSALPAFCYLLHRVTEVLKDTKIVCIINTELKAEIAEGFEKACEKYGVQALKLCDIHKIHGHPTIKGMAQIKEQIIEKIR